MKQLLNKGGFYLVTDPRLSVNGVIEDIRSAVEGGCTLIQYREKEKDTRQMINESEAIVQICKDRAIFLINDRIDIALAVSADGVHLGQEDMSLRRARTLLGDNKIIGVTVHNEREAQIAIDEGADYLAVSPIYQTSTKPDAGAACGLGTLEKIRKMTTKPIVAIGGINIENTKEVVRVGADYIVAISDVVSKKDVTKRIGEYETIIKEIKNDTN